MTTASRRTPRTVRWPSGWASAAMAAAPLRGNRLDVIGTLAISYREPRDFPERDQGLLQGLADMAAIAVANSRLYQELHDSERRYHYLLSNSPDIVWQTDADGRFTFLSDVFERIAGVPSADVLGAHFASVVHADSRAVPEDGLSAPEPGALSTADLPVLPARSRRAARARSSCGPSRTSRDGSYSGAHGIMRDLRDQVRLEDDLRRQAADLGSAKERARLAQELHDSVTQALFSMTLTTRSVELLIDRDPAAARQMLGELRELEREALAEMRALIFELRPANLEQDGLVQALQTHAAGHPGSGRASRSGSTAP